MTQSYLAAYDQGYAAQQSGQPDSNPYLWYTVPGHAWAWGYSDAEKINRRRTEALTALATMQDWEAVIIKGIDNEKPISN